MKVNIRLIAAVVFVLLPALLYLVQGVGLLLIMSSTTFVYWLGMGLMAVFLVKVCYYALLHLVSRSRDWSHVECFVADVAVNAVYFSIAQMGTMVVVGLLLTQNYDVYLASGAWGVAPLVPLAAFGGLCLFLWFNEHNPFAKLRNFVLIA